MTESDIITRYNAAIKEYGTANILLDMNKIDPKLRKKRDEARVILFDILNEDGAPEAIAAARGDALEKFTGFRDDLRKEIEADQQDGKQSEE